MEYITSHGMCLMPRNDVVHKSAPCGERKLNTSLVEKGGMFVSECKRFSEMLVKGTDVKALRCNYRKR